MTPAIETPRARPPERAPVASRARTHDAVRETTAATDPSTEAAE